MQIDLEKQEVQAIIDYYKIREKDAVRDRDYILAEKAKQKCEKFTNLEINFASISREDLIWNKPKA